MGECLGCGKAQAAIQAEEDEVGVGVDNGSAHCESPAVRNRIQLELTEILGLYEPGHRPADVAAPKLAEYHAGYLSGDDRGRIFIDRALDGAWTRGRQAIQLTVRVTVLEGTLPADAEIRWGFRIPPDPILTDVAFHDEARAYISENYYEPLDDQDLGLDDGKNLDTAWVDDAGKWEAVDGYALSASDQAEARTAIAANVSKVVLKCPSVGGDRLIVGARLATATDVETNRPTTGRMTLWKRIDVELVKMVEALPLAGAVGTIPAHFEPACVQLDFTAETTLPGARTLVTMVDNPAEDYLAATAAWIDRADVFTHRNTGGWFCLAGALLPAPTPQDDPEDPVTVPNGGYGFVPNLKAINVRRVLDEAPAIVRFTWDAIRLDFMVARMQWYAPNPLRATADKTEATSTLLTLSGHLLISEFTGHDSNGSAAHANRTGVMYFPFGKLTLATNTFVNGQYEGYRVPGRADAVLIPPGHGGTSGISPPVTEGGTLHFAGRTILFTHHSAYSVPGEHDGPRVARPNFNDAVQTIIVHELTHAFGMPHMCGYWDYRAARERSCCMNYPLHWIFDDADRLEEGTANLVGTDLCARHIMEVRRVKLMNNPGLHWA